MNCVRLGLLLVLTFSVSSCSQCSREKKEDTREQAPSAAAIPTPDPNKAPDYSGITVDRVLTKDIKIGKGAEIKDGSQVSGFYKMWVYAPAQLANKGKFVSGTADDAKDPYSFRVGQGEVIKGWEQGVVGMRVGGKRSIIVPISLGYGEKGTDVVPPGSILLIEFEAIKAH